jgi:putative PEP-CTERM system histidine kinase
MLSDIGYGVNGIATLVLLLLLFTVRKSGLAKYLLVLASMVTLAWSVSFLTSVFGPITLDRLLISDTVKQIVWLLFIASCLRNDFRNLWQVLRQPATIFILAIPLTSLVLPYVFELSPVWRYLFQTIIALEVLILLEVLYRQADEEQWAFKPLVLYLGATNLYEFVAYADATMVTQIELGYIAARGYIYALMLPFLIIAIRRIKHWGIEIFISRDVVLHSSLLLVAGGYLCLMSIIGYAVNYLGGSWSATVQIILIALSLIILITLFLSNSVRTRIKVFITKHFFANQFDYREEWVKLTQALSQPTSSLPEVYQVALNGMLNAVDYDSGLIVKRVGKSFNIVSERHFQLSDNDEKILKKLSSYCERKNWLVDIEEYVTQPFSYEGLHLSKEELEGCRLQIVIPLLHQDSLWGLAILTAVDRPKVSLNWEVRDYLTAVTDQVSNYIYHYEAAKSLTENAQFAAFNRMAAFVLHDLKNVLAQIDLILCNAEQHKHNPEFIEDTFETLHHTKSRMDKMLKQLTEKKVEEGTHDSAHTLSPIIRTVIDERCQGLQPLPELIVESEADVIVDHDKFSNVMYHLLTNAQQATADDGKIEVTLALDEANGHQLIFLEDSGCGMDESFIEHRLFKPFDTTKGNAGMGIGAYDAKAYMEAIGGYLKVQSKLGVGTCFTLAFPLD